MSRLGVMLLVLFSVALAVSSALFRVWVHQDAVQLGYRLSEREQERRKLTNTLRQLEVELAAERAPENLLNAARRLKLQPPAPTQLLGALEKKGGARGGP